MIRVAESRRGNVQGTLLARFQLKGGKPVSGKEDDTTFFFIDLTLDSPVPDRIKQVTYVLDDSYWEPKRECSNMHDAFREEITSMGNIWYALKSS